MGDRAVAVLAGGLSHEREVSLRSGRRLAASLRDAGFAVVEWDADAGLLDRLRDERPDAVLVAMHGGQGEDGSVQTVLEMLGIPFVGADSRACRAAWDKPAAKSTIARAGLSTPDWIALPHGTFRELGAAAVLDAMVARLGLPLVLKPDRGGSALGAQVVRDATELPAAMVTCLAYGDTVLAERFVEGVEVAVSVIDDGRGSRALPAVEVCATGGIYDYTARYTPGATTFHCPARLSAQHLSAAAELALAAHELLGLRDVSRTDAIVDSAGDVQFLEVNVSPGLTETSLTPTAVAAAGLNLGELYGELIRNAIDRGN